MNAKRYTAFKNEMRTHLSLAAYTLIFLLIFGLAQYIANQPTLTKFELLLLPEVMQAKKEFSESR